LYPALSKIPLRLLTKIGHAATTKTASAPTGAEILDCIVRSHPSEKDAQLDSTYKAGRVTICPVNVMLLQLVVSNLLWAGYISGGCIYLPALELPDSYFITWLSRGRSGFKWAAQNIY
jgi:hypothetical protein